MDRLLPRLMAFPPYPPPPQPLTDRQYDEGIRQQIESLKKIPNKDLLASTSGGESPLNVINPAINTVPYTFILLAHIAAFTSKQNDVGVEELWGHISTYLCSLDGRQVRYLGFQLYKIVEGAVTITKAIGRPAHALMPICTALTLLDPSRSFLTTIHIPLVRLALETTEYEAVLSLVEQPVLYFSRCSEKNKPLFLCELGIPPSSYISSLAGTWRYQDILDYFWTSALICIGSRKWEAALDNLESCILYPLKDHAVSRIMVEAYKKWILVNLILTGKAATFPPHIPTACAKAFSTLCKPYDSVAIIFENGTAGRLKSEVEFAWKIWSDDGNRELMTEILAAYQKTQIRKLANIYTKITLTEVASQTRSAITDAALSTADTRALVEAMIQDGSLHATVTSGATDVLNFDDIGRTSTGAELFQAEREMEAMLAIHTQRIQALAQEIKTTDHMLTHDQRYVNETRKTQKAQKEAAGRKEGSNMVDDEDLMGNNCQE